MTSREKGLLAALVGLGILLLILFGVTKYKQNIEALGSERDELAAKMLRYKTSPQTDESLREEKDWISENEPSPVESAEAVIQFESLVQNLIKQYSIQNASHRVTDNDEDELIGVYSPIRIEIKGKDSQEKILRLLVNLHIPSDFRAVTGLSILNTASDGIVDFVILVEQKIVQKVIE